MMNTIALDTISIHAPVKGATFLVIHFIGGCRNISIHAPVKGATDGGLKKKTLLIYFNPRTREGCDHRALS